MSRVNKALNKQSSIALFSLKSGFRNLIDFYGVTLVAFPLKATYDSNFKNHLIKKLPKVLPA